MKDAYFYHIFDEVVMTGIALLVLISAFFLFRKKIPRRIILVIISLVVLYGLYLPLKLYIYTEEQDEMREKSLNDRMNRQLSEQE